MRLIAVDEDEAFFMNHLRFAVQIQQHRSPLDKHQQKAVKGVPFQRITGLIGEKPALKGIEKNLLRCFAG